jgi:hypothetical protein
MTVAVARRTKATGAISERHTTNGERRYEARVSTTEQGGKRLQVGKTFVRRIDAMRYLQAQLSNDVATGDVDDNVGPNAMPTGYIAARETERYGTVITARITTNSATRASQSETFRVGNLRQRRAGATEWLVAMTRRVMAGEFATANALTLRAWVDRALTVDTKRAKATTYQYRTALTRHLEPFLDMPLTDITREALEDHYASLAASGAGLISIARSNAALSAVLAEAVRARHVPGNPAWAVDLPTMAIT